MRTRQGRAVIRSSGIAGLLGLTLVAWAPTVAACKFPASGQTTAYTADENDGIPGAVDVPDDGTIQAGKTLRYQDKGLTIKDKVTKLEWEKKDDAGGLHDKDNAYPWSGSVVDTIWDWLEDVNMEGGTGFAGHNDWRISNVRELLSIINYKNSNPAVSPVFSNGVDSFTAASFYWSSTSRSAVDPTFFAWIVDFIEGFVTGSAKSNENFVRAVRGGCMDD